MNSKGLIFFSWLIILLVACQQTADSTPTVPTSPATPAIPTASATTLMVEFNKTFTLRVADTAVLGNNQLTLTFLQVVEDSRCPTNVECVQAGQARISLQVEQPGKTAETFELNSQPPLNQTQFTYQGYTIELLDLTPYPTDPGFDITATPYQASLRVTPPNAALPLRQQRL